MNTVASKKTQCSSSTGPVPNRTGTRTGLVDLLGARLPEPKRKKEKRLGYLGKKELLAEVRKIFLNATVLPNEDDNNEHIT
jgi:hypothetical protein